MLPPEKTSEWKNHIGMLVHTCNCTRNSATGFSPYYLMYGRQPHLPVDVVLGLPPQTMTAPDMTKFMQKMREHAKWAWKKAETFQAEEAECHKHNYDKHSRAAALEFGDTVLVHVTTFKSHHKIQDRWENREYVVDKHLYPNVPVYVVWPRDGEGCSQTLHRNYLLPINSKMGQDVKDTLMAGVENNNTLIPATPVDREPAEAGPSGMVILSTVGNTPQSSLDQPAPLRCSVQKSQNWLPCSYLNSVCWQLLVHLASGMNGLVCVSASMSYSVCTPFPGRV